MTNVRTKSASTIATVLFGTAALFNLRPAHGRYALGIAPYLLLLACPLLHHLHGYGGHVRHRGAEDREIGHERRPT